QEDRPRPRASSSPSAPGRNDRAPSAPPRRREPLPRRWGRGWRRAARRAPPEPRPEPAPARSGRSHRHLELPQGLVERDLLVGAVVAPADDEGTGDVEGAGRKLLGTAAGDHHRARQNSLPVDELLGTGGV